ncbi:MAG: glycosyltransferase family 2 protein, partial [Gammaproteobacteria bacterium]|nr:glycosyltransferase family 2 protein [Gammaproteobacteria bacterium]
MTRDAESPLVAVVTPVFNGEKYLKATMECVQEQTYLNLVHVVLDNASTDSTPSIIEAFKGQRVPLLSQRNPSTIPSAKNWSAAVRLVPKNVKYFAVLCADDLIEADFVAKMVAVAESDPDVQLVGCMHRWNKTIMPASLPKEETVFDGPEVVRSFLNKESNDIPHMWGLFRRREEDFATDFYDDSMYMEDTDACLRAMVRGKFGFVHEPLYTFRLHPDSISETFIKGSTHPLCDSMREIERWGPVVMSGPEFRSCAQRHLRAIYR